MAIWPATLPAPALNTFRETPPKNTIRTEMDAGPPKVRRRTTANVRPVSFTLKLSKAQLAVLDSFFVDDTFSGAEPFQFEHPRTLEMVQATFAQEPSYSEQDGVIWNADISLEILP